MRRRYRLSDMTCAFSQAIHGLQRFETLEGSITQTSAHEGAVDTIGVVYLSSVAEVVTRFCAISSLGHHASLAALAGRPNAVRSRA